MNELESMLIGTMILYAVFVLIREYNALVMTKYRFRYFALRDRLAMLVAAGKLDEDSWEYQHIVDTLNFHISAVEDLSIMRVINLLVEYHTSKDEESRVQKLSRDIDREDIKKIVVAYMTVTHSLIRRNSRVQMALLSALAAFVPKSSTMRHRRKHTISVNPKKALTAIEQHKACFDDHCPA